MKITYNQQEYLFNTAPSVHSFLVDTLEMKTEGIAVAINSSVISRANWETTELHEGDNLLIINATQGG